MMFAKEFENLNFVGSGIFIVNREKKIIFWNRIMEQISGVPASMVKDQSIFDCFPHLNKNLFKLRLDSVLRGGPPEIFSAQLHKYIIPCPYNDHEMRMQNTMAVAMWLPEEEINAVFSIQDVTNEMKQIETARKMRDTALAEIEERKKIEFQLQQTVQELEKRKSLLLEQSKILSENNALLAESEKQLKAINATKDLLFSIIAHDIKSPLHGLIGYAEILLDDNEITPEQQYTLIKGSHELATNLNKMIENLLQWARLQSDKIRPEKIIFNPEKLITECIALVKPVADKKEISLTTSDIDNNLFAYADVDMITAVLRNFISNAIKFTRRGGKVIVGAQKVRDNIEFSVKDTGVGMPPDKAARIFELEKTKSTFGTEKEKGTGLGLVLCKELILKNNGTYRVESLPGEGTTFCFSLPSGD